MMEDDQEGFSTTDYGQNTKIDPEVWLQYLLMLNGNPHEKEKMIRRISEKTGVIPEHVDKIMQATLELMFQLTRAN
jgi:hypothetical protein